MTKDKRLSDRSFAICSKEESSSVGTIMNRVSALGQLTESLFSDIPYTRMSPFPLSSSTVLDGKLYKARSCIEGQSSTRWYKKRRGRKKKRRGFELAIGSFDASRERATKKILCSRRTRSQEAPGLVFADTRRSGDFVGQRRKSRA